ncbi:MAG TPA: ADP-ribosyltransferase [Aldersonia sp.]
MASSDDPFEDVPYPSEYTLLQDLGHLTAEERDAVGAYTAGAYLDVNEALRGRRPMTAAVQQGIEHLRSALAKFPLPSACRVSRETELEDLGLDAGQSPEDLVGEVLQELGFLSASGLRVPPRIVDRRNPVWLDLVVAAGVPALLITEELTLASASEREVLLIDARELFDTGVHLHQESGLWVVQAMVIDEE